MIYSGFFGHNLDHGEVTKILHSMNLESPFRKEFYIGMENIKLIKSDRFEKNKDSIIDINSSYTTYMGQYKDQPIVVREIFEKYSNIRQCMS
jgi:hypothetical protein